MIGEQFGRLTVETVERRVENSAANKSRWLSLRPYQEEGVAYLAAKRHALLAFEMRLGKSATSVIAAHRRGAKTIAVACPAIAVPQWEAQIRQWWPSGSLPFFKVASYEKWTNLWKDGLTGTVDVFIPDEAHFAKNPDALRTRMVYGNKGIASRAGATWALSGTPATKHAGELWPMMRAFGVVKMDYNDFVQRYCTFNFNGLPTGTKVKYIPELRELLATFVLRRTRREVAPEMPEIGFEFMEVDPVAGVDLQGVGEDAEKWLDGVVGVDREDRQEVAIAKGKQLLPHVQFAVENGMLNQVVIFGWHRQPLIDLCDGLNRAGIRAFTLLGGMPEGVRQQTQKGLHAGICQVVCAQIRAAGTAIDLSAARHGYFLELSWLPSENSQAAARLVSLDRPDPVTFDVVTWPGSADDRVQKVLMRRTKELSQLL